MTLHDQFTADHQGRKYSDVLQDPRLDFAAVCKFVEDKDRQRRLWDSEIDHDRPALAGIVRELEARNDIHTFLAENDGHTTTRFRQAVGVLVRIVMENNGWRTTGQKGSLGQRKKAEARTTDPGAYQNASGLSRWFVRAERYYWQVQDEIEGAKPNIVAELRGEGLDAAADLVERLDVNRLPRKFSQDGVPNLTAPIYELGNPFDERDAGTVDLSSDVAEQLKRMAIAASKKVSA